MGFSLCPKLKNNNNNEHLPVDRWEVSSSSAPEWTRQAWMGFTSVSFFMDACTLESALMQHLKWTTGSVDTTKGTLAFVTMSHSCNVTNYQLWRSRGQIPCPARFGKKNSFHFNIEIQKPTHWFNFWKSVILSIRPNDDNHYTFLIFTHFSAEKNRLADTAKEADIQVKFTFFLSRY